MDEQSADILRRVEQNDDTLKELDIGNDRSFNSSLGSDFNRLGVAIATNLHITRFEARLQDIALNVTDSGFYEGLKRNSSIKRLVFYGSNDIMGGVGQEILQAYQLGNNNLTGLCILCCNLRQNRGCHIVATTLRKCTNIEEISLYDCNISGKKLLPLVEAMRGHGSLKMVYLNDNFIGDEGCEALATVLGDPNGIVNSLQISV